MIVVDELPRDSMEKLSHYFLNSFSEDQTVRIHGIRLSLSAALHRLHHFAIEDCLNTLSSFDLLHLTALVDGELGHYLARVAATRAVIENNPKSMTVFHDTGLLPHVLGWHLYLSNIDQDEASMLVALPDKDLEELYGGEVTTWSSDIFRATIRIVLGRRFAALIAPKWIDELDPKTPVCCHALLSCIAIQRPDLHATIHRFLRQQPNILLAGNPDDLLIPLVACSTDSPQTVLAPFQGYFDESVILAASEWHLDHQQYHEALELSQRIRFLSAFYDQAQLVTACAHAGLQHISEARHARDQILDHRLQLNADIVIAEDCPTYLTDDELCRCCCQLRANQGQLLYRGLSLLLRRNRLDLARDVCLQQSETFNGQAGIGNIISEILRPKR